MLKIVLISVGLIIGFSLDIVSMFTNGWICVNQYIGYTYYGIVPFRNDMPFWFRLGSVLMYCSFASYLILAPLFIFVV
ncbi:unnamed protein product [Caenorhabditis angaria]|uniref:Uncharacterized protein n=1 Tax=Caenorhabditis angaria TaxID=860376 RepID=A0A9P1IHY2_9PELO|nr:unnamed protein product [Caenorhabditis angaria]